MHALFNNSHGMFKYHISMHKYLRIIVVRIYYEGNKVHTCVCVCVYIHSQIYIHSHVCVCVCVDGRLLI